MQLAPLTQMQAEISYDVVMDDDNAFTEGTFRLSGREWQVFIFSRKPVDRPAVKETEWDSGVTGVFVSFPDADVLNKQVVQKILGAHLRVAEWVEARGPDSMHLR